MDSMAKKFLLVSLIIIISICSCISCILGYSILSNINSGKAEIEQKILSIDEKEELRLIMANELEINIEELEITEIPEAYKFGEDPSLYKFEERKISHLCRPDRKSAEIEFVEINKLRRKHNLPNIIWEETLYPLALERATDMARRGYFSHYDPNTGKPMVPSVMTGEVLAVHLTKDFLAAEGWYYSPPHWNVLKQAKKMAVAYLACDRPIAVIYKNPGEEDMYGMYAYFIVGLTLQ
ncbi:MAG: CAP domain-containing protein [Methylacidiphilales bacterium]|nr:CAP domain-containing protein [Candidatus Methylacidiphilales bacterium]